MVHPCYHCAPHPALDAIALVATRQVAAYDGRVGPSLMPLFEVDVEQRDPELVTLAYRFGGLEVMGGPEDGRLIDPNEADTRGLQPVVELGDWTALFTDYRVTSSMTGIKIEGLAFDRPLTLWMVWMRRR